MKGSGVQMAEVESSPLLLAVERDTLRAVEISHSLQYHARGMELGVDWRQAALRVGQLRRRGQHREACLLETHQC